MRTRTRGAQGLLVQPPARYDWYLTSRAGMSEGGRVEVSLQKANSAPQSPGAGGGGGRGVCSDDRIRKRQGNSFLWHVLYVGFGWLFNTEKGFQRFKIEKRIEVWSQKKGFQVLAMSFTCHWFWANYLMPPDSVLHLESGGNNTCPIVSIMIISMTCRNTFIFLGAQKGPLVYILSIDL